MDEESVGPYRLESLIGEGGMGQVWRARDTRLGERVVALKVLSPGLAADPAFRERFTREADRAAGLRSPHIIPIHTYGEAEGRLYIEMPLARGTDLDDLLARSGPLPPARAVRLVAQVARALDVAHGEGLVHRDVKPGNVLVDETADDFAYLVDFGIAKTVDGATGLTGTRGAIGSLPYMAPERLEGRPDDHRVDVYALGVVLFELLAGRRPFAMGDMARAVYAHVHEPVPAVSEAAPGVPAAFDAVVRTAMAKDPAARYPSAGALADAARRALDGAPAGPPPVDAPAGSAATTVPRQSSVPTSVPGAAPPSGGAPPPRRRWPWVAAAAVVVLLLGGATVWWASGDGAIEAPPPVAVAAVPFDRTLSVPAAPGGQAVATSPDGAAVYVVGRPGTLTTVDATNLTPRALLPLGEEAYDVAVHPDGGSVWVTTASGLAVVDPAGRTATRRFALPDQAYRIAMAPDGRTAWVTLPLDRAVVSVDTATGAVADRFEVGDRPEGVAVSPDGDAVYVAVAGSGSLVVVDPEQGPVGGPLPVGPGLRNVSVAPDGQTVWLSSSTPQGTVSVVEADGRTVVATVPELVFPGETAFAPDGAVAYVRTASGVAVVDTRTRTVARNRILRNPADIAVGPAGTQLYSIDPEAGALDVSLAVR